MELALGGQAANGVGSRSDFLLKGDNPGFVLDERFDAGGLTREDLIARNGAKTDSQALPATSATALLATAAAKAKGDAIHAIDGGRGPICGWTERLDAEIEIAAALPRGEQCGEGFRVSNGGFVLGNVQIELGETCLVGGLLEGELGQLARSGRKVDDLSLEAISIEQKLSYLRRGLVGPDSLP